VPLNKKSNDSSETIIIDPIKGLEFESEEALYSHFESEIEVFEKEYQSFKQKDDIPDSEHEQYESQLSETLEQPDEIWIDKSTIKGHEFHIFLKEFTEEDGEPLFHIAVTYSASGVPSFIYLHFPTRKIELVEKYQRDTIAYDRILEEAPLGAIEGDALLEGDELAIGYYQAMLKVRSEEDIPESKFREYAYLRETAIEEADEIWRHTDPFGNVLVNFYKEFSEEGKEPFYYVVVTLEDAVSNSHALLFSFPTTDLNLTTRYKQGESLHAEDVSQEASH
jgi:hypothetical protein